MKDYFNSVIRPALERMERTMGITHIQVSYVPSLELVTVREHCRHLVVEYGECANPDCRLVIEEEEF